MDIALASVLRMEELVNDLLTLSRAEFAQDPLAREEIPLPAFRITSYNVCYTKLLRIPWSVGSAFPRPRRIFRRPRSMYNGRSVYPGSGDTEDGKGTSEYVAPDRRR